ncbi:MAG TPA: Imm50 family immunity protein [Pyrinomonadaceae bacterium]|nr:Imm50 family immunity protein [Pyrinomonadaceae bacterium]
MENKIQNTELLMDIFGKFPNFHDAEVVKTALKRKENDEYCPILETSVLIKHYGLGDSFLVNFKFKSIFGLKLENFNRQNVLGSLEIQEFDDEYFESLKSDKRLRGVTTRQEVEGLNFYVRFNYCFGIEAEFLCESIVIESVKLLSPEEIKLL